MIKWKTKTNTERKEFTGDVRMKVEAVENFIQVNQLCLHLKTNSNIKIESYNWSEKDGLVISLSIKDSVPLSDVLEQIPMVEQSYRNKSREITVELNNSFSTDRTPVSAFAKKCVAA